MSKVDTLLKKAIFFEKMAIYSDRKTFLQALSQEITTPFTQQFGPDVRRQLESVYSDLDALRIKDPNITQPVYNSLNNFDSLDKNALLSALKSATSKYPPNASGQLDNLRSLISKLEGPSASTTTSPVSPAGGTSTPGGPRQIDKAKQEALSKFVTVQGIGLPLKITGVLDSETRKALDAFNKYMTEKSGGKNRRMSDDEALTAVKYYSDNGLL